MFLNKWGMCKFNGKDNGWAYIWTLALLNIVDHLLIHSTNGYQIHSICKMWLVKPKSHSQPLLPCLPLIRGRSRHSFSPSPLQLEIVMWHHYDQWNARGKLLDRWFEKDMSFLVKKKQVESSSIVPCFLPLKMAVILGAFDSILWLWSEGKWNHRATNLSPYLKLPNQCQQAAILGFLLWWTSKSLLLKIY